MLCFPKSKLSQVCRLPWARTVIAIERRTTAIAVTFVMGESSVFDISVLLLQSLMLIIAVRQTTLLFEDWNESKKGWLAVKPAENVRTVILRWKTVGRIFTLPRSIRPGPGRCRARF